MAKSPRPQTAQELALMQGFPPPEDKLVTVANFQVGPYNRWGFQHISQILPTAPIGRGDGTAAALERRPQDLGALAFTGAGGRMTIAEMLETTYTDGFLVLKDGAIVAEQYFNGMGPHTRHLLMSVSKSLTGMLAGILVERGLLDPGAVVSRYVPALRGSAYEDASVQQVLDMVASVIYSEDYDDPRSEVAAQDRSVGWRPAQEGDIIGLYHFLPTLKKAGEHGTAFQYCSANTDVLGWVMETITDTPFADLFSREIWSKLGAEDDGYITVDRYGATLPDGGFCLTLRDLARFGQMVLQDGHYNGQRIVPARWIDETRHRGDNRLWPTDGWRALYPRGSYHNQWSNTEDAHRSFFGIGINGQHLWLDPSANVVIVKFSSWPIAWPAEGDDTYIADTFAGFTAIGQALA